MDTLFSNDDGPPSEVSPFISEFYTQLRQDMCNPELGHVQLWRQLKQRWLTLDAAPELQRSPTPPQPAERQLQPAQAAEVNGSPAEAADDDAVNLFICVPEHNHSFVGKMITRSATTAKWRSPEFFLDDCCSSRKARKAAEQQQPQQQQPQQQQQQIRTPSAQPSRENWRPCNEFFATVAGSPATAVNIALCGLSPFRPDLVISGPNFGRNCGRSFVLSSGTVAAALEAVWFGFRAVSISFTYPSSGLGDLDEQTELACRAAVAVVRELVRNWPASVRIFNVNIPLPLRPGSHKLLFHPHDGPDAPKRPPCEGIPVYACHILAEHYGPLYAHQANDQQQRLCLEQKHAHLHAHSPSNGQDQEQGQRPQLQVRQQQQLRRRQVEAQWGAAGLEHVAIEEEMVFEFQVNIRDDHSDHAGYLGSDLWAVENGAISVTPMHADLRTDFVALHKLPFPRPCDCEVTDS